MSGFSLSPSVCLRSPVACWSALERCSVLADGAALVGCSTFLRLLSDSLQVGSLLSNRTLQLSVFGGVAAGVAARDGPALLNDLRRCSGDSDDSFRDRL